MDNNDDALFGMQSMFPNAEAIFSHSLEPLEKLLHDCLVVLDTNVLLLPYNTGKTTLDQIAKIYKLLIEQKRLIIPGQVAREFAKNRGNKIAELFQQISRKSSSAGGLKNETYPLLESLKEYKEIVKLEEEINKSLAKYRKSLGELLEKINLWQWNDPVIQLYRELFSSGVVLDVEQDKKAIQFDLNRRFQQKIPPGYKDAGKPDSGIGDLLIWYTILSVAEQHKKSVIFVSGDEKSDWQIRSEGQPLYPRYELIDEFRQKSDGASFQILSFSKFLDLFGVSESVVAEIREKETLISEIDVASSSYADRGFAASTFYEWLKKNYPLQKVTHVGGEYGIDIEIIYDDESKIGVDVTFMSRPSTNSMKTRVSKLFRLIKSQKYKAVILAVVTQYANQTSEVVGLLDRLGVKSESGIAFLVGHVTADNKFRVGYFE
jgi:rRNA-processing protein FCF1